MELNISELVIEATRKCNMKCEHCMRGAAQRKTISDQHIHKILQIIDNVGTLTITGGEPTLAMETLDQIKTCIIYGNADVSSFYMVTNGKAINIDELAEWAAGMMYCCSDNEISGVGFSFDQFHTQTLNWKQAQKQKNNYQRLKDKLEEEYGIYENDGCSDFVVIHSDSSWGYDTLLKQGRAEDFGGRDNSKRILERDPYGGDDGYDTLYLSEASLTLTCSGYLIAGGNWSYHNMDNDKAIQIGHIDDINCTDDLIEAIKAYNKRTGIDERRLVGLV